MESGFCENPSEQLFHIAALHSWGRSGATLHGPVVLATVCSLVARTLGRKEHSALDPLTVGLAGQNNMVSFSAVPDVDKDRLAVLADVGRSCDRSAVDGMVVAGAQLGPCMRRPDLLLQHRRCLSVKLLDHQRSVNGRLPTEKSCNQSHVPPPGCECPLVCAKRCNE